MRVALNRTEMAKLIHDFEKWNRHEWCDRHIAEDYLRELINCKTIRKETNEHMG